MTSMRIVAVTMTIAIGPLVPAARSISPLTAEEVGTALKPIPFLDCSRLPRSDPNPTGYCSELEQPYFAGFVEGADG